MIYDAEEFVVQLDPQDWEQASAPGSITEAERSIIDYLNRDGMPIHYDVGPTAADPTFSRRKATSFYLVVDTLVCVRAMTDNLPIGTRHGRSYDLRMDIELGVTSQNEERMAQIRRDLEGLLEGKGRLYAISELQARDAA